MTRLGWEDMKVELVPVGHRNTDVALVHREVEANIAWAYDVPDPEDDKVARHTVDSSAAPVVHEVSSMPWTVQRLMCLSWEVYCQDQVERWSLPEAVF